MVGFWEAYKYGERGDASGALARRSQEKKGARLREEAKEEREESRDIRRQTGKTALLKEKRISNKEKREQRLEDERRVNEALEKSSLKSFKKPKHTVIRPRRNSNPKGGNVRMARLR